MRFADIACGSGSFLIGVYDELLRHRTSYYNRNKRTRAEGLRAGCLTREDGTLGLSLLQKSEILTNNIYGVDIDGQAVEVAQLSLYLKLLEDETPGSTRAHQQSLGGALLPSLTKNIVSGNALIGTDFVSGKLFTLEEDRKYNVMDFESAFPAIMKDGGFDAIVGNPPYGMVGEEEIKRYIETHFTSVEGRFDLYELFIERAIKMCRVCGLLGYIVPSPLLSNLYTRKLRRHILDNSSIQEVTNFGMDVFTLPTVHTCIVILSRDRASAQQVNIRKQVSSADELYKSYDYAVPQSSLGDNESYTFDIFIDPVALTIIKKMQACSSSLGGICYIRQCIKTGDDQVYVQVSESQPGQEWKPSLRGRSIGRYATTEKNVWLRYGSWLARNWQNQTFYETPKLAIRETGNRITATIDLEDRYFLSSLYAVYPKLSDERLALQYLLGIVNSSLATYFVKVVALELTKGAFTKFRTNQLARLPIRTIDFSDDVDRARHDRMVQLVEVMLATKQQQSSARTDADINRLAHRVADLDRRIDELVYELYALTAEEVKIVEDSA